MVSETASPFISNVKVDGIAITYFDDNKIVLDEDTTTTYADIKDTYDVVTAVDTPDDPDNIADIEIGNTRYGVTGRNVINIMRAVNKIRRAAMNNVPEMYAAPSSDNESCITRKEELEYDDLCTLEALLSYFKHDEALDVRIAELKEEALLSQCKELKAEIDFMKAPDVSCSMKGCNAGNDYKKSIDALMLMTYMDTTDIPKTERENIIEAAAKRPYILLNFIDDDVILSWPITKIVDGQEVMVSHGLKASYEGMEDVLMKVSDEMDGD